VGFFVIIQTELILYLTIPSLFSPATAKGYALGVQPVRVLSNIELWFSRVFVNFNMIPLNNRLRKTRDFNLVIKHGRWVSNSFLTLKSLELAKNQDYFPKKEDPDKFVKQLKLAFSVGLKVSKSAVKRNRVRRQMSEVVRLLLKEDKLKIGYYLMFVAKKEVLDKNYAEISQEIKLLLSKTKVLL